MSAAVYGAQKPGGWLLAALWADAIIGALIGLFGFPGMPRLLPAQVATVFGLSALCALVLNDFVKCWWLGRIRS